MAEDRKMITWTPKEAGRFKAQYLEEVKIKTKDDTFLFNGDVYVLGYAKYLIEYLEMQWGTL